MQEEFECECTCSQPVEQVLEELGDKSGDTWLWCLHCCRFFQAKNLRIDFLGNRQGCAFADCDGAGFNVDIHLWDTFATGESWPQTDTELRHGMQAGW